jgi:acetate kinase
MEKGVLRYKLAFDIFCYRIRKYIGAYAFAMGGLDAVVFTGGIGENSPLARAQILADLSFAGIELDQEKNNKKGEKEISTGKVKVLVIPTNEELVIARETREIIEKIEAGEIEYSAGARV